MVVKKAQFRTPLEAASFMQKLKQQGVIVIHSQKITPKPTLAKSVGSEGWVEVEWQESGN